MSGERAGVTSFTDPSIRGDCDDFLDGCRGVAENWLVVRIEGNIIGDGYLTAKDRGMVLIGFFEEGKWFGGEALEVFCRMRYICADRCKEEKPEHGQEIEGMHYWFG